MIAELASLDSAIARGRRRHENVQNLERTRELLAAKLEDLRRNVK